MARKGGKKTSVAVMRLVDIGAESLAAELGLSQERARMAMREIAHKWCREKGGGQLYLTNDKEFELLERDMAVWREWTGNNIPELAQRFDLSERQVYFIIAHLKKSNPERQGELAI